MNHLLKRTLPFNLSKMTHRRFYLFLAGQIIVLAFTSCSSEPRQLNETDRPKLSLNAGIMHAPVAGVMSANKGWIKHGDYLAEVIRTMDTEWHNIIKSSNNHLWAGTSVIITFNLNKNGQVAIKSIEIVPHKNPTVIKQCVCAITNPQPYRKWTSRMVTDLGNETQLTLAFHYQ